jgi:hypothetical protein
MQLVEPTHGEACCRRCVPAVSFHLLPHSPYRPVLERERNAQVDRCLGRIARAASSWVTQAARCFGCRTESSRSTTTEPSQTTSLRLLRSRRLVVSQVAMLEKPTPPTGMHPQFPSLKLSTATVINFFEVVADTRITDQAHGRCGSFTADVGRAHYARQAHQRASATANRCARGTACTADPTRLATHSSA